MGGKMNWDRVRKENLARLHGSDWVEIDPLLAGTATTFTGPPTFAPSPLVNKRNRKSKKNKKNKSRRPKAILPLAARMLGCTCGKPTGFIGLHKKRCPLCGDGALPSDISRREPALVGSRSGPPTPEDYARLKAKIEKLEAELLRRKRK
jgi:hypothetical protein